MTAQQDSQGAAYFDGRKLKGNQKAFLWFAAIAYAFDLIDTSIFGYVAPVLIKSWGITMEKVAELNSLTFVGMFLGGLVAGWLADKVGRKITLLTSIGIFSVASICTALCQPYHVALLELTRFFTGVGVIGMSIVAMVYIAEMMPSESRGKYQSIAVASGTIALPLSTIAISKVLAMGPEAWRYIYWAAGASVIMVPIGIFILRESPRWLVTKGRIEEAEKVMFSILGEKVDLSAAAAACAGEREQSASMLETIRLMFSKAYIKRSIVVFCLAWGVIIGNMLLSSWYPTMMTNMGVELTSLVMVMSITAWGQPIGDFLSSFFSDKGGRKIPIVVFSMISGVLLIAVGFAGPSLGAYAVLFFFKVAIAAGATAMMWSYLAESYPTRIRTSATGVVFSSARILIAAITVVIPALLASVGYLGVHLINSLFYIIPAIVALIFGEKTGKKTLEELNEQKYGC